MSYAPFGEPYNENGTQDRSFTGQNQDTSAGLYDFEYREYNPAQGRWPTPDPAGRAAVDPTTPQSWNRYAYVNNVPLSNIDPKGEEDEDVGDYNVVCDTFGDCTYVNQLVWGDINIPGESFSGQPLTPPPGSGQDPNIDYTPEPYAGNPNQNSSADSSKPSNNNSSDPGSVCDWGTQWLCNMVYGPTVYQNNLKTDQEIFNMTSQFMDPFLMNNTPNGAALAEIYQLESTNLLIDQVALGNLSLSALDSVPGLNLLPPGINNAAGTGIDYFESVRGQNNQQIDQILQNMAPPSSQP